MRILVLVTAVLTTGCMAQMRANYDAMMAQWVDHPAETLVESWGYPAEQLKSPAGNTVYVYHYRNSFYFGNTLVKQACNSYFEIGPDGKIVKARGQGNACAKR